MLRRLCAFPRDAPNIVSRARPDAPLRSPLRTHWLTCNDLQQNIDAVHRSEFRLDLSRMSLPASRIARPSHQVVRYHTLLKPKHKPRADQVSSDQPHHHSSIGLNTDQMALPTKNDKEVENTRRVSRSDSFDARLAKQTSFNTQQAMRYGLSERSKRTPCDAQVRGDVVLGLSRRNIDSAESQGESQRCVRFNDQARRQERIGQPCSPSQIHYRHIRKSSAPPICHRGIDCESEGHKREPRQSPRIELRHRRRSALEDMRKALAATLFSYEARTAESVGNADMLASLPAAEKPSPSTQIGTFITALGFYDSSSDQTSSGRSSDVKKTTALEKESDNRPLQSMLASDLKSTRVLPQSRLKLCPTARMRGPQHDPTPLDAAIWGQSVDMMTCFETSDQGDAVSDGSASLSHDSASQGANAQDDLSQQPSDQSTERNSQSQIGDRGNKDKEEPPSESEREDASESDETDSDMEGAEELHVPLTYQIPAEVLKNALEAPAKTRASYWTQKLYRGPNDEKLLLYYCRNMEVSEEVAKSFLKEKVLGFDIEWKAFRVADSIKDNASLIQIASENAIALFHIARFPGKTAEQLMPPTLKIILQSPDILKVGVAIKGDCSRLEKYFDLRIQGVFELSRLYNLVEHYATDPRKVNKRLTNLATQVQKHLLLPLYKGEPLLDEPENVSSVRESDWTRPLDSEQMHYAAADAYAGLRLFDVLESKRKKLKPTPPIPPVCDFDVKPVSRSSTKSKRVNKAKAETTKAVAEALSGLDAEDAEEEEEAYETAAEELADEEESEDSDASSQSDFSAQRNDPDADYVPKRRGRVNLASPHANAAPDKLSRHDGRAILKEPKSDDPGYPKLPVIASQEHSSDESDAFDPPLHASRERGLEATATKESAPTLMAPNDLPEDEYSDPELEEAFASMDLGPTHTAPSSTTFGPQHSAGDTPTSDPSDPKLETPSTSSPAYTLATTWAQSYLASTIPSPSVSPSTAPPSRIRATIPPLRAYHLWHHQRIPLDTIGAHLRDPPLAQSTVCNYIMQAITMEKLEYREEHLRELMKELPASLRMSRYAWLSRKVGLVR